MKAIGKIEITDELTLLDPTLEIIRVNYNWDKDSVDIECLFSEGVYKHSRTFTFSTDGSGELTTKDILSFIINHEILYNFT